MGKKSRIQSNKDYGADCIIIAVGSTIATVDWKVAFSSAIVAGVISLLTSIAGLPEVKSSEESTK